MSQYIRTGMAGTNRLSRLGRLRGRRLGRRLGQDDGGFLPSSDGGWGDYGSSSGYPAPPSILAPGTPGSPGYVYPGYNPQTGVQTPPGGSGAGWLTPSEASVISTGITTAGRVATTDIVGGPQLTYNPATGQYTATGGATIPSSSILASSIASYLPLALLAGGAILLFSMMGRR
jgi:hypothetical protein